MSEPEQGQPRPDTVEGSTPDAAPEVGQPETPPTKYTGKSVDDLAKMLEEQDKFLGRQAVELGQLRKESDLYKQYLTAMAAQEQARMVQQQQAQAAPEEPVGDDKFDWDNPEKAVDIRVERKLRKELEAQRTQMAMENAMVMGNYAKSMAKAQTPHLFNPQIEQAVDQVVWQGLQTGLIKPYAVTSPDTWRMAAWQVHGAISGYAPKASTMPVQPQQTELPSGSRPPAYGAEEPVRLDEAGREMIKKWGGTSEEEAIKAVRELRARERGR